MVMVPDPTTCWIDPFQDAVVLHATCTVRDPDGNVYAHCPRSICQKASKYATETGVADHIFFGPEAEFFVFDDVKFAVKPNKVSFEINGNEAHWNNDETPVVSGRPSHNLAHRVSTNSSYFPVAPLDQGTNLRNDMLLTMADIGIPIEKHHHEVATCQHELGFQFRDMLQSADIMMSYKYVVKNVARKHGKTATFMPKPISGANGSGMHCHMSLWKEGKNLFFDKNGDYAKLSKTALYYIGGLIRHAPAVLAFSNSTVNSYKRLVPGFEAPVNLAFSTGNRSAAIRIPACDMDVPKAKRLEFRCSDAAGSPYLTYSALLMAGLDGIRNKIEPGPPLDCDLYKLSAEKKGAIASTPASLADALCALEKDHDFLTAGGVFTQVRKLTN
eukprot:GHVT01094746.1.p1 GENE.GHVT01094746.1~~GHVT01094746.1.p1  ORF type:complete len:412 (-),score=43.35 GHVT01094746.1:715-1872(-)